jgi:hypothetical protein
LLPTNKYIPICRYNTELLSNLKKEQCGLIGHSNAGPCGMDSSGLLRALKQVWLNKGGVATIIPLKQLEKLCPMKYDSTRNGEVFVCRTKGGDVMLKNNGKGMPYLDHRESRPKQYSPLRPK